MEIVDIEVLNYEFQLSEAWDDTPSWHRKYHNAMTGWDSTVEARQECIVKVHTDEGIVGIGSADKAHRDPRVVSSVIEYILKPELIGEDPTDIERLWQEMWSACGSRVAGAKGIGYGAIGGINIACWDILGKKLDCPVYELLGGDVDVLVEPYIGTWSLGWRAEDDIQSIVDEAAFYVDQGYDAIKIRGGRSEEPEIDLETIRAIREQFGPDELDLMIDVNGGYDRQLAEKMIVTYEEYDLFWVEDPFETTEIAEFAEYQKKTSIDVFIGGGPSKRELTQMIKTGSTTNLASLSTEHGGGISEAMKVATLADSWNLNVAGIAHEPLGSLPLFHVWKALPSRITRGSYVEYDPMNSCWEQLLTNPPEFVDGELVLSDEPGLGTDVDDDFIADHPLPSEPNPNAL